MTWSECNPQVIHHPHPVQPASIRCAHSEQLGNGRGPWRAGCVKVDVRRSMVIKDQQEERQAEAPINT